RGRRLAAVLERHGAHPAPGLRGGHHPLHHLGLQGLRPGLPDARGRRGQPVDAQLRRLVLPAGHRAERVRDRGGDRGAAHRDAARRHRGLPARPVPRGGAAMRIGRRSPWASVGIFAAVAGLLAFTLFPAYFMLSSALAPKRTVTGTEVLLPEQVTLDNFSYVLTEAGFLRYLGNSLFIAVITVLGSALLALLAAVAVSRFRFRFRTTVLVMVLVVQMVPLEALVIPLFLQASSLNMLNSLLGLSVVYVALSLPFAIWMLRGFTAAVPAEVEEAAYIDGASWGRMFWSVLLPLVAPGLRSEERRVGKACRSR